MMNLNWKPSKRGGLYVRLDPFTLAVFGTGKGWSFSINEARGGGEQKRTFGRRKFPSKEEAASAAEQALALRTRRHLDAGGEQIKTRHLIRIPDERSAIVTELLDDGLIGFELPDGRKAKGTASKVKILF